MKKSLIIFIALLFLGFLIYRSYQSSQKPKVSNFEECVSAGYPVAESYPRQCITDYTSFIEDIGNELQLTNEIRVENPRPNQVINSPVEIVGVARGYWFFEANLGIELYDATGKKISQTIATAKEDWMTEELVPFKAGLEFQEVKTKRGELIVKKANPSGMDENEESLRIPVRFE